MIASRHRRCTIAMNATITATAMNAVSLMRHAATSASAIHAMRRYELPLSLLVECEDRGGEHQRRDEAFALVDVVAKDKRAGCV